MKEKWKDIKGYENLYQVSNLGNIKRLGGKIKVIDELQNRKYYRYYKENFPKQFIDSSGYKTITLKGKRMRVHRLVAQAFLPNPELKPCINHKDGNKLNNNINNLEWCTYYENSHHAIENGLSKFDYLENYVKRRKVLMLDDNFNIIKEFNSITEAFEHFNMKYRGSITEVCEGKRKHFKGYRWKYVE